MRITPHPAPIDMLELRTDGPRVDIGLPAYKRPHFIGEAIESVLAQTYQNWRLHISENGPGGDAVEAAVQPYVSDPRITYSATGENLGPAANWTRLVQSGSAPYFTLIQDDDKWDPDFLARRVAYMEHYDRCGFVYSGERKMDQHGRAISLELTPSLPIKDVADVLPEGIYEPRQFVTAMYHFKLGGIHPPSICSLGVMSRRTALESVGAVFDQNYPFLYWDVELYMKMAMKYPVGFMAIKDATQRIHHPSITSEHQFDGEHWIRYHTYHGEWFTRELPGLKLPRGYYEVFADAHLRAALDAVGRDDRRKALGYLRKTVRLAPRYSLANPRVVATAAGLLLGRRGSRLVTRLRAARARRHDKLVYLDEQVKA
jgi:glycosyltransferase involved in cell wall biosynthesis